MVTVRTLGGVALLLAGSTWLWLTPAFAGRDVTTGGFWWALTRVLALVTVVAFCLATIGLFARQSWWERAAVAAAMLGLVTLVPYWVAADRGGEPTASSSWNVLVHVVMAGGVMALVLVPTLERWVDHHVMSG